MDRRENSIPAHKHSLQGGITKICLSDYVHVKADLCPLQAAQCTLVQNIFF